LNCVLKQANDHCKWADYSYICVPVNALKNQSRDFMRELFASNIGLIVANENSFFEVLKASYNTFKNGKDKNIRSIVSQKILDIENTQQKLI